MDPLTPVHPVVTDSTDDTCPGCGGTNPVLAIIGVLPTPQLRGAAFLAFLRSEVARRSREGPHQMTTATVSFPVDQVAEFEAMASVARTTTTWWCRLCGQEGTATTTPHATDDAIAHLGADHGGVRTL